MTLRLLLVFALALAACKQPKPPEAPADQPPGDPLLVTAPPDDAPAPTAELKEGKIVLSQPIVFVTGQDILAPESEAILGAITTLLADRTDVTLVRVEGHSDSQGADAYNQQMSEHRALALARWLAGSGIDCKRLIAVGFGETKPIADNRTAEGRAQNRRMELIPAALRGTAIGGMPVDGGGQVAGDPCPAP